MKKEKRELEREVQTLASLHTAGQSHREVGLNVGLSVLKSYKNGWTQPPQFRCRKGEGGEDFLSIRQALLIAYSGPLTGQLLDC